MAIKDNEMVETKAGKKRPYTPPAVVYNGRITTRAGSPTLQGDPDKSGVDPADLFGDG